MPEAVGPVMTTSFGCIVTVSFPWGRIQKDYVEKY